MTAMDTSGETQAALEAQAVDWVVRIQAPDVGEADLIALTEWLERSPRHLAAFDRAESVWLAAEDLPRPAPSATVIDLGRRGPLRQGARAAPPRRHTATFLAAAAVACLSVGAAFMLRPDRVFEADYATPRGKTQTVTLADGTVVALNSNTRLHVRMSRRERAVTLAEGEAALTVTHDARRPLVLKAGDLIATDLGTRFDVLRHDGVIRIAVKDGSVGLSLAARPQGAPILTLKPGDGVQHREGAAGFSGAAADPETAYAWQGGRVVYKNRPLSEVVSDLNRYFDKPLVVDEEAGKMGVTAVFTLDSEASVVRSLQAFLPIAATTTNDAIVLRASH